MGENMDGECVFSNRVHQRTALVRSLSPSLTLSMATRGAVIRAWSLFCFGRNCQGLAGRMWLSAGIAKTDTT